MATYKETRLEYEREKKNILNYIKQQQQKVKEDTVCIPEEFGGNTVLREGKEGRKLNSTLSVITRYKQAFFFKPSMYLNIIISS